MMYLVDVVVVVKKEWGVEDMLEENQPLSITKKVREGFQNYVFY